MVDVNTFLLMLVYMACFALLICLIVFSLKLIKILNRFNRILDEVDKNVAKFDKTFQLIDVVTDNMALVSDKLADGISNFIRRMFYKKKIRKDEENNE